jgi:hypothetical protein
MIVEAENQVAFDPALVSVASLARMGPTEFEAVQGWIAEQRAAREQRALEHEERMAVFREQTAKEIAAREAVRVERSKTPAMLTDVA